MEDETAWADEADQKKIKRKRPPFLFPILILLAVGLAGGGIYSLVNRQLEGVGEEIKADVRRTHQLVINAADAGDVELFTTFLSGRDARWLEQQRESVKRERFDEAPLLGIELAERPLQIDEVTLASTLDEATVTYTRWYSNPEESGAVFGLQQIANYRRGEDRWLLAPPTDEFWGDEATVHQGQMTVLYPERDEIQAIQLSEDLAAALPQICEQLPANECPNGWQLTLKLSADPKTTLFQNQIAGSVDGLTLVVPAPTLLGMPIDEAGYEAVFQSYNQLLQRRLTAVFTIYLSDNPNLVPPILQVRSSTGDFLEALPSERLPDAALTFSCSNGLDGGQNWHVFNYSLRTGEWSQVFQREYHGADSGFVIPLYGGGGYVIQEYLRDDLLTARLLLWEAGQTIVIGEQKVNFDSALAAPYFLREMDPSGRYLLIGESIESNDSWFLLDRQTCSETGDCTLQSVLNAPIWSPDGRQMLMQDPQGGSARHYRTLYLADEMGRNLVEIGQGAAPFWLDENTYGYSRLNEEGRAELVLANSENSWVVLETAEFLPLLTDVSTANQMTIWNGWANPQAPMLVLMATTHSNQNNGPYHYFLLQVDPEVENEPKVDWLFTSEIPGLSAYTRAFSPFTADGRFLMFRQRGEPIYFHDLETGMNMPFDRSLGWIVGWSPDGRFYTQWSHDGLTLTEPATGFQAKLAYDLSNCIGLEWVID